MYRNYSKERALRFSAPLELVPPLEGGILNEAPLEGGAFPGFLYEGEEWTTCQIKVDLGKIEVDEGKMKVD